MSNEVYANGREIACKAANGKSICAFPDVCLTPPSPPAGPIPIPYPNTGMASDTDGGSKTVLISGQEVMLKDLSDFKKSTGDEAATKSQGMNVITHQIQGKCYFTSWSMDVKIEGENAVRHLDMMTHNHASLPGGTPPWPYLDEMNDDDKKLCEDDKGAEKDACFDKKKNEYKDEDECCADPACQKARNCMLVPYGGSGSPNCCKGLTGHHLLPNSLLQAKRGDSTTNVHGLSSKYNVDVGACVCVDGKSHSSGEHGELHTFTKDELRQLLEEYATGGDQVTKEEAVIVSVNAHAHVFQENGEPQCQPECIQAQVIAACPGDFLPRQQDGMTRKNFEKRRKEYDSLHAVKKGGTKGGIAK